MDVPENAMALGVPAKIREDASSYDDFRGNVETYVANTARYKEELRRLD
jgi:serine acetyltransferase